VTLPVASTGSEVAEDYRSLGLSLKPIRWICWQRRWRGPAGSSVMSLASMAMAGGCVLPGW
jgi:hypothetical protein